jgi:hypothetical protein
MLQYLGAILLANGVGAAYALYQNNWTAARTYLAISTIFYGVAVVLSVPSLTTPPGVPPIVWGYAISSVVYVAVVLWIWRSESARMLRP